MLALAWKTASYLCLSRQPRQQASLPQTNTYPDWAYLRLEFSARSMCDGISVWTREMARLANERSPTVLAHEVARSQRMADIFEGYMADPLMKGASRMAHFILAVALERARYCGP